MEPVVQFPKDQLSEILNDPVRFEQVFGQYRTISAAPTDVPKTPQDQIRVYKSGATTGLYIYDKTNAAWYLLTAGGGVAGSDKQVQFNDGGVLGASADFTFDKTTVTVSFATEPTIATPTVALNSGVIGIDINAIAGDGDLNGGTRGGAVFVEAGGSGSAASVKANGSSLLLNAGTASSNGGGAVIFGGNAASGAGNGGEVNMTTGISVDGNGGDTIVFLETGNATTGKDGTFEIQGARNTTAKSQRIAGRILTTNNTPTNAHRAVIPTMASTTTMIIQAKVSARRTGGTAGAAGDSAAYIRSACYKNIAGTVTLVGAVADGLTAEDQAGWDCTFVISGTDVFLQVTGATDNNVTWNFELMYVVT